MKSKGVQRFLPYEEDYSLLKKCRNLENIALIVIGICSILLPVFNFFSADFIVKAIYTCINLINFVIIIAYYILNIYTETFLCPATARKRRKGFIDNSLGSKFLEKPVEGYYTNDNLDLGLYKLIVNCGENCYFTYNIAKAMIPQIIIKNAVCAITFLCIAYWGIKDNLIAIPTLQILFSALFITELVHHINFITKLNQFFERFKEFFSKKADDKQILQEALLLFSDYETTLAYNKAPLSDSVYEKIKKRLSKEWEDIKERYEME